MGRELEKRQERRMGRRVRYAVCILCCLAVLLSITFLAAACQGAGAGGNGEAAGAGDGAGAGSSGEAAGGGDGAGTGDGTGAGGSGEAAGAGDGTGAGGEAIGSGDGTGAGDSAGDPDMGTTRIYLYGEQHGKKEYMDKEFELWKDYYDNQGMRHLFIEHSYYAAEFLNLWMQEEDDSMLIKLYSDWEGTAAYTPLTLEFYRKIKEECPETVFHGTDVGHQYESTGPRYLNYLEENGQKDTEQYRLAEEAILQGEQYYKAGDDVYRENTMVENFIREFGKLDEGCVMGIYGSAHTGLEALNFTEEVPCMAKQLKEHYGDIIESVAIYDLTRELVAEPYRTDTVEVGGREYQASYFGEQDLSELFPQFQKREFWRLEDSYEDFRDKPKTGDMLPYDNYPMELGEEQVFVIDYTGADGTVSRKYYRSDGGHLGGYPATEEFTLE